MFDKILKKTFSNKKIAKEKCLDKSGVEFDGKTYPVKMDKSTAQQIADDKANPSTKHDIGESKILNFVRGKNYERLARRSQNKAIKAIMKATEFNFHDLDNREEHEDEFMRQMAKRQERERRAKKLDSVSINKKSAKEKCLDKSEHRKYTTKYEDLCQ